MAKYPQTTTLVLGCLHDSDSVRAKALIAVQYLNPTIAPAKIGAHSTCHLQVSLFQHMFMKAGIPDDQRYQVINEIRHRVPPIRSVLYPQESEYVRVRFPRSAASMILMEHKLLDLDPVLVCYSIGE